ncbi:MAG: hypothetical protein BMS9Abin12_0407 [Acidimicrobiia bacterium]|nr:MAG: hypothetical protein BMS9Abin12_0407 [Acidimicrobiia bacterium]
MPLQMGSHGADALRMETKTDEGLTGATDQELVDLYTTHAPRAIVIEMTDNQIHHASAAAYALEYRGYIEQAGIWLHDTRPALQATA